MKGRILILEDESEFAEMLSEILEANDFDAVSLQDSLKAIEKTKEGSFDLLVTDFMMPKLDGIEFVQRVREFNRSVPVILISAFLKETDMERAAEAGVTRILKKPFESSEFLSEISALLDEGSKNQTRAVSGSAEEGAAPSSSEEAYPKPLEFLSDATIAGSSLAQDLWGALRRKETIFLSGERGFEIDPILSQVAEWGGDGRETCVFDLEASALLSSMGRDLISRAESSEEKYTIFVAKNLTLLDRSQQKMLHDLLDREDSYLRRAGQVTFVFAVDADRLALAELSMDESLTRTIFQSLVRVPPLGGRYSDIGFYLKRQGRNNAASGLSLTPEGAANLLRYEWPGNYAELIEIHARLTKRWGDSEITGEKVRVALEKRRVEPLDELPTPDLSSVLGECQMRILEAASAGKRKNPESVLKVLGCPDGVTPSSRFPQGQELIYPELIEASSAK